MLTQIRRLPRVILISIMVCFALLAMVFSAERADAHPAGTTGVLVTVQSDAVELKMQIQMAGFVTATEFDVQGDQSKLDEVADNLMTFILHRVSVSDEVGTLTPSVIEQPTLEQVNGEEAVVTKLRFADDRALEGKLKLDYNFILDVLPSHQVYVALVSDWNNGKVAEGDPEIIGVLGGGVTQVTLERTSESPASGFFAVVWLGMLHIAEGTDHLLFLSTLLIVAPSFAVRARRWGLRWNQPIPLKKTIGRAALIITSFTVGHLITLALVSLGLISFPTKPVEILVAVSIIVAAIHAIKPLLPRGELLIAGLFGLVHGTAFATTILDLNLGFSEKLLAILGFNVGVELAQLIAAVLILPLLIWLSHARAYSGFRIAVASVAIVAATAWIVAISIDGDSVLTPLFAAIAQFPVGFYVALVVIVAVLWYFTRNRKPPVELS